jgi:hypothetical protein
MAEEIKVLFDPSARARMSKLETFRVELRPRIERSKADHAKVKAGTASADEVLGALSGSIHIGEFDTAVALVKSAEWKKILDEKMAAEVATHAGTVLVRVLPHLWWTIVGGGCWSMRARDWLADLQLKWAVSSPLSPPHCFPRALAASGKTDRTVGRSAAERLLGMCVAKRTTSPRSACISHACFSVFCGFPPFNQGPTHAV